MVDLSDIGRALTLIVMQLEGPYKWYVLGGAAFLMTAVVTQFIFKTFKWFLMLLLISGLMIGGFWLLVTMTTSL